MTDPTLGPSLPSMTTSAQNTVTSQNQPAPPQETVSKEQKKLWKAFKDRCEVCKTYKRKLIPNWQINIDVRRGKPFASHSDEDRISVPLDWALTKTKQSALFSQIPQARVTHPALNQAGPTISVFERKLNDTLLKAGIEPAMDEVLPDVINASGIGAVIVAYEALTEDKEVPVQNLSLLPPDQAQMALETKVMPDGSDLQMEVIPQVIDKRYTVTRISPSDLLWPISFTGSDLNSAPWIGRTGRVSWAVASSKWNIPESDKEKVLGEDRSHTDKLTNDTEKDRAHSDDIVSFDEIFYREVEYDPSARSFSTIHHLIFVNGLPDPVVDEPWKGQRIEGDVILGSSKFPVQCLTLTYISDETVPPSDSAMGRPQVNEINKLRSQVILQRDRNIPIRWFDVNRIDPAIQQTLMRGAWQAMIPVQGSGTNILGEVAKTEIPNENYTWDSMAKSDLADTWSVGPGQLGSGQDLETKGEVDVAEGHFQTRIGRERAKVAKFFCLIAEIMGGLLCLYEDPTIFGEGFDPSISTALEYSILADSTVLLDSKQKLERLINFVNFGAKSGWVNIEPVMREIATLTGLDPNTVIVAPQPTPPPPPNISLRLSGAEDMMNPLLLAFLLQSGQGPSPEVIEQAKQLLSMIVVPAPPPPPPMMETGPDGSVKLVPQQLQEAETPQLQVMQITLAPALPPQEGQAPMEGMEGEAGPDDQPLSQGPQVPSPPPPEVGQANPNWNLMPKVSKRASEEKGGPQ